MRATFEFVVRAGSRVLNAAGALVEDEDQAVTFRLRRSPLVRERHLIDVRLHDLAGGLEKWLDLQQGIESVRSRARAEVIASAFATGEPEVRTPEERHAAEKAWSEAWAALPAKLRAGLEEMIGLARRLEWMARWAPLFVAAEVGGKPVAGWEDVAEVALGPEALDALWTTHDRALDAAEADSGKAPPSAS